LPDPDPPAIPRITGFGDVRPKGVSLPMRIGNA
jgi:hypothetical protein